MMLTGFVLSASGFVPNVEQQVILPSCFINAVRNLSSRLLLGWRIDI